MVCQTNNISRKIEHQSNLAVGQESQDNDKKIPK